MYKMCIHFVGRIGRDWYSANAFKFLSINVSLLQQAALRTCVEECWNGFFFLENAIELSNTAIVSVV